MKLSAVSRQLSAKCEQEFLLRDFRSIKAWEKSHHLTLAIYAVTKGFPRDELFGLTSQIRRACASIPANIAEGCGRSGEAELARFFQIASGSASELEYHLLLAHDLHLMGDADYARLANEVTEVKRMLTAFIQKLRAES
jgi:four helix bundle protein